MILSPIYTAVAQPPLLDSARSEKRTALLRRKTMGLHVAGVDILRSNHGPVVMEVNSSPGLEGIEGATHIDVAGRMIEYLAKTMCLCIRHGSQEALQTVTTKSPKEKQAELADVDHRRQIHADGKQQPFKLRRAQRSSPGQRAVVDIPFGKLYTHTELNIGAHVVHGKRPGPVLLITAALHGDEINGVEICRRLLKLPKLSQLRGTLVVVPIVNTYGFVQQSRYLPDRRDLNRSFPGSEKGSLGSRMA